MTVRLRWGRTDVNESLLQKPPVAVEEGAADRIGAGLHRPTRTPPEPAPPVAATDPVEVERLIAVRQDPAPATRLG
jgi:hypothetical protein